MRIVKCMDFILIVLFISQVHFHRRPSCSFCLALAHADEIHVAQCDMQLSYRTAKIVQCVLDLTLEFLSFYYHFLNYGE